MAEANDQSGFNQAGGKRIFSKDMPQVVSTAEPGQDAVATR